MIFFYLTHFVATTGRKCWRMIKFLLKLLVLFTIVFGVYKLYESIYSVHISYHVNVPEEHTLAVRRLLSNTCMYMHVTLTCR